MTGSAEGKFDGCDDGIIIGTKVGKVEGTLDGEEVGLNLGYIFHQKNKIKRQSYINYKINIYISTYF